VPTSTGSSELRLDVNVLFLFFCFFFSFLFFSIIFIVAGDRSFIIRGLVVSRRGLSLVYSVTRYLDVIGLVGRFDGDRIRVVGVCELFFSMLA
jgi:hypothetical protein